MNIFPKHRIATMVAATSIASLLVTATTQGQAKAVVLNYQGTDYDFTVVTELGTSANLTSNFWWSSTAIGSNPTVAADAVGNFLDGNSLFRSYLALNGSVGYVASNNTFGSPFLNTIGLISPGGYDSNFGFVPTSVPHPYVVAVVPAQSTSVPEPSDILGTLFASLVAGYGVRARRKLTAK
jgi:hypothetical protein